MKKFTTGEYHAKDGQVYSMQTGKTIALIPYFDKEDEEHMANQRLFSASSFMYEKHEENMELCDSLLNAVLANDDRVLKLIAKIKSNCIYAISDADI